MSAIGIEAQGARARVEQPFIPLCVPEIRGNEWTYIKECLDTSWVSSVGAYVDRFERALADVVGTTHAVATMNGTAALHTALLVAGVEPEDEVLVSTLTFIAPVNAIRYVGAWPVFIDAEPEYWQMDVARVVAFLDGECAWRNGALFDRRTGRRVRAIVPVHVLGHPVDMDPLREAARAYGLAVIEDATESLGARYRGRRVGALGDIGCFSFNGNKLITTGGGGMLVTDDEPRAQMARYLTTQAKDDPVEFVHGRVGFNYRLTNIQAALGVAQLELLEVYLAAKRRIAATYDAELADLPGLTPMREAPWAESAMWMYTVLVDPDRFGMGSRALLQFLSDRNIQTRPLWQPIHRSRAHRDARAAYCPVAERLNRDALSLPCSVGLTEEQQARVIAAVREACVGAGVVGTGVPPAQREEVVGAGVPPAQREEVVGAGVPPAQREEPVGAGVPPALKEEPVGAGVPPAQYGRDGRTHGTATPTAQSSQPTAQSSQLTSPSPGVDSR